MTTRAKLRARHRRHKIRNIRAGAERRIKALEVFTDNLFETRISEKALNDKLRREVETLQRYVTALQLRLPVEVCQQVFVEIQ